MKLLLILAVFSLVITENTFGLTENETALLSQAEFKKVSLSPDGQKIAVSFKKGEGDTLVVLDRKTLKPYSGTAIGENYFIDSIIWLDNQQIVLETYYQEGYLKKNAIAKGYIYTLNYDGSRKKQIFPPYSKRGLKGIKKGSWSKILSKKIFDKHYLLVQEYSYDWRLDKPLSKIMQVNVKSGRSKKILDLNIGNGFYVIDNSLEPRLALKPTGYKKNEIGYKNAKGNWFFEDLESAFGKMSEFSPIGFGAKNSIFYFLASFSEEPLGIYSMTVSKKGKPGAIQKVFADKNSNVLSYIWDNKNHRLISADYGLGKPKRKYFFKNELIKELQQIDQVFPEERVVLIQVSDRENVFKVHSSKRPTSFYLFDRKTKKMSEFLSSNEKVDTKKTVSSKPISFKTRDGIQIHGFLHLPKGQKTAPMLINIHGGPFGVADHWGFNGEAQFLAQRGYASLQVNFRGSGSRGEKFVNLGKEVIGTKMQYDIIDAAIWAKSEGYSNGKACLWGVSYGGYSSVMTFLMRQDLFECAIGAAGVYNLNTILKMGDIQFSELGKAHWNDMLPKTKEERFLHSPISLVEKLHKPLYIVHGKSDVRVPVAQARDLKKQLKKANKKFQYKEYKGVGHWFVDDSKRQDFFKRALRFFDENLKK